MRSTLTPTPALLITQCLQNDFVQPIGKYDPLPNLLHVGYEEARRLIGEEPADGPLNRVMWWAAQQVPDQLAILHIRDWHDPNDPRQQAHLRQFGDHCLMNTPGAAFAFDEEAVHRDNTVIVNSLSLNDFVDTNLEELLALFAGQPIKVGLIGVWTEAKITFLAYELRTRYPEFELALCSALTASSSRAQHFVALDQLEKLLGVTVYSSIGRFIEFLGGAELPLPECADPEFPKLEIEGRELAPTDRKLLRWLFRDSQAAHFKRLNGGFSGNVVLGSESTDMFGHRQAAHVVKIGPQELIGRERASFERIESVLGNNAPRIVDFADLDDRGGIKYRYASMGGGFSTTFQKLYMSGLPMDKVKQILRAVFVEQLGRFYAAASREKADLLDYYTFTPEFAPKIRQRVEALLGHSAHGPILRFSNGKTFPNVCRFYEEELSQLPRRQGAAYYFAYVHGDLNGANIIVDGHENVWLIDFFFTHRGHVLRDLVKLENDLLYIMTVIENEAEFDEALHLSDALMQVEDLGRSMPDASEIGLSKPKLLRTYETLAYLHSFYPDLIQTDRDPLQLFIAQMRYAMHTLGFDESNERQKKWALYTGALCSAQIIERLHRIGPLHIGWIDRAYTFDGRLGITILPGRKDHARDLASDIAALREQGVTHVVVLLPPEELADYGVPDLLRTYADAGFTVYHLPICDQGTCSLDEMRQLVGWLTHNLQNGAAILVHCVGGLGRSGMAVASYLRSRGLSAEAATQAVRDARSPRAIESAAQEEFVRRFG